MNKNIIIVVLVVIVLAVGGYFIFIKKSSAPSTTKTPTPTPTQTPTPVSGQSKQTGPVTYTDSSSFAPSFSQCNPSEFKTAFPGPNASFVINVLGVENGKCHYTVRVVDQNDAAIPGGPPWLDCKIPKQLISNDVLGHLFGADKTPAVKAAQDKIEADYCTVTQ